MAPPTAKRERDQIAAAMIELCFERGLPEVTLPDLLARAGVDEEAFHRHHGDLQDCFTTTYEGQLERFRRETEAAREGHEGWRERLRATAYALYRFLASDERVRWLTAVEVRRASPRAQLLIAAEVESLFDLIDEGRRERPEAATLTRATAETIGGAIFNQIYSAAGRRGVLPAESEIVPPLMYMAVLPYLGEEAAREELAMAAPPSGGAPTDPG